VPDLGALGGLNALVAAANPVLAVVPQIRHALRHPDPEGLRVGLRESLDAFERKAREAGIAEDEVSGAACALCALLDESAASTPWGAGWAKQGLLAERHPDANGDDRFFELVDKYSADPAAHLMLLEFFYVCLALGFEGPLPERRSTGRGAGAFSLAAAGPDPVTAGTLRWRTFRPLARRDGARDAAIGRSRIVGRRYRAAAAACGAVHLPEFFAWLPVGPLWLANWPS
jgi:hypothetical protein